MKSYVERNLSLLSLHRPQAIIFIFGLLLILPYAAAWQLGQLRRQVVEFEMIFWLAFALYAVVTVLALRATHLSKGQLILAVGLAAVMQGFLIFTRPTLSDDIYRYVWDGRVQAHGLSPYLYPPRAPQLTRWRDRTIWLFINRKRSITVYPPAAQMTFALLWRIWPDSTRWFQIVMAASGLLAGLLLVGLLAALGRSTARGLIYLWSPLLAFETAHAGHLDALILPLLVGAWWARVKERDTLVGVLLGLAAAIKFYPALLLPALWRPQHPQGRWRMPLAFAITVVASYLPYLAVSGTGVIGFLPKYLHETFNLSPLVSLLRGLLAQMDWPRQNSSWLLLAVLVMIALLMVWRPAPNGESAVRRSIWFIGAYILLTPNLLSWYLLWLLPLLALFMQPGGRLSLRLDAWTGWWLFSGLIALSYTFFIYWKTLPLATLVQFWPLYLLLLIDLVRRRPFLFSPPLDETATLGPGERSPVN